METQEMTPEEIGAQRKEAEENAEIVARAKECYRLGTDATAKWREQALEDLRFLAGDQWDPTIRGQRDAQGRPALTVNRLPQFVGQVANELRQSKPAINVKPVDSQSDPETAEVFQGVIRNIEYSSNAGIAYVTAGTQAARTGIGYFDIRAEYEDEKSFEQRIVIERITNSHSVVMDPGAKQPAGDDARWVIRSTDMAKGEWKAKHPGKEPPLAGSWRGQGDAPPGWVAKDGVRIHEYRYVKEEPDVLIDSDAGPILASEDEGPAGAMFREKGAAATLKALEAADIECRPTTKRKACWAKIAGDDVTEKGELVGRYLQLARVIGTEIEIDGETIYEGVATHAKDSQRMLNYYVSAEAEAIALAPKAPFIATPKQIEGHEAIWENANQRAVSVLPYNPDPAAGGPPQRVFAEPNVQAITNARMLAQDDLKGTTSIYDASLGAKSNEQSGKAILARQSQGQTATFHYSDNLGHAITYAGRVMLDMIPRIYPGPRVVRMLGEDNEHEMVPVNGAEGEFRGKPSQIQLDVGRYDVTCSMGPSFHSRRQEASATLIELSKVDPAIPAATRDLLVESMDMPNGKAIAERLRKTLPPEIRPQDEKLPPPQVLAQQVQQSGQLIEQLTAQLNQAKDALEKDAEASESRERIEFAKLRVQLVLKLAELDSAESVAALKAEYGAMTKRLQLTDIDSPIEGTEQQGVPHG